MPATDKSLTRQSSHQRIGAQMWPHVLVPKSNPLRYDYDGISPEHRARELEEEPAPSAEEAKADAQMLIVDSEHEDEVDEADTAGGNESRSALDPVEGEESDPDIVGDLSQNPEASGTAKSLDEAPPLGAIPKHWQHQDARSEPSSSTLYSPPPRLHP
jgi:hypothetical protein